MVRSGAGRWVAVVVVLVASAGIVWWLLRSDDPAADPVRIGAAPAGRPVSWSGLEVAGERLTVSYGGSPCQESNDAVVDERDDRVVVTVYAEDSPGACILSLQSYRIDVRLEAALGARPVYDGACLEQAASAGAEAACRRAADTATG